jgi:hypothetical protein
VASAQARVAAVHADHRRADERRVEEQRDEVCDDIKDEHPKRRNRARLAVDGLGTQAAQQSDRHRQAAQDQQQRGDGQDRQQHEFLVRAHDGPRGPGEIEAAGEATGHQGFPSRFR